MTTAIHLLRARLFWVQVQIAKELTASLSANSRMELVSASRLDVWGLKETWLVDCIRQLEAEQEAGNR